MNQRVSSTLSVPHCQCRDCQTAALKRWIGVLIFLASIALSIPAGAPVWLIGLLVFAYCTK